MSRLSLAAFVVLAVATVGAFFVTQHLKVTTPLIAGAPKPAPAAISPGSNQCGGTHRATLFSFYLLHRADDVAVYVVDQSGTIVRTITSGRHMRVRVRTAFHWNGREDDGTIAPDGTYYFRVALLHQNRTIEYTRTPIQVLTSPPRPVVTSVSPSLLPQAGSPAIIRFRGNEQRSGFVRIYRTDLPGSPRLVKVFRAWKGGEAHWDGKIRQRPAPAGTYLVGLEVKDAACNTGEFPPTLPPAPNSTPRAGVTVRYLAAQPPLDPVPAGTQTTVYVDARRQLYSWTLERVGARKPAARGSSRAFALTLRIPAGGAGLYVLFLRSGGHHTAVPVMASAPALSASGTRRPLVVLPALTWQGLNPVDDDGNGLPNTLTSGGPIALHRPLADGLPADFADEADFVRQLDHARLRYDLTTDLGLIDGVGPSPAGRRAVILDGSEQWLPASLGTALRSYVQRGGHLISIGTGSMLRGVTVRGGQALDPSAVVAIDIFGVRHQPPVAHTSDLITVITDNLGIFSSTSGALPGFHAYEPLASPSQPFESAAGASTGTAAVAGLRFGQGVVVEIALPGFGASLAHDVDAQELVARLWQVLG